MDPEAARDLLKVDAKDREAYRDFSLVHLTAYSVHWLTQWSIPTTYENVSVLNARLFPQDFSMRGFPELPDAFRTNRSLLQMRPKYRNFATSDPRKGVYLTEKGQQEATRVLGRIGSPTFNGRAATVVAAEIDPRRPTKNRERSRNPAQHMQDVRSKILFRRFKEAKLADADVVHLLGLLELYDHTLPSELRKRLTELRVDAAEAQDTEVLDFLAAVSDQFRSYLHRESPRLRPTKSISGNKE